MTVHTKADMAAQIVTSLVDNRKNDDEPTAEQVISAFMEIDPNAKAFISNEQGNEDQDGNSITFEFSDGSTYTVGK